MKLREQLTAASRGVQKQRVIQINFKTFAAAASVIGVIVLAYFIFRPKNDTTQKLFSQNFVPYQMVITSRGNDAPGSIQSKAIDLYRQKSFEKSIEFWNITLEKEPANTWARFYRGVALLATEKPAKARKDFEQIISADSSLFIQQARWFKALTYLQDDDINMACDYFDRIKDQNYEHERIQSIRSTICR